ncbi:MAG: ankyrin repeat domain-containing protein [Candidatus Sericytochromatia bacterium]|nr:ankyrin repeat domain-containing protein [Candidatus Sericytochromatia bacterium]
MRPHALTIALTLPVLVASLAAPAAAYYPDEHVWDREYQSGAEWGYPQARRPVPWLPSAGRGWGWQGWQQSYGPQVQPATWQAASASGWLPMAQDWAYRTQGDAPWNQAAWNVAWWSPEAPLMTNPHYQRAVRSSATNPYSNQMLNRDLAQAAALGDLERARALISHGADLNARDQEGYTPLTWAAQHGRRAVVEYLLARFAQPNVVDRWGYTPLMWALQQGHTDVAAVLLQQGANPRVANAFGVTPLVLATYAANGASRPLVEEALAGRAIRATDWFRRAAGQPGAAPQPPGLLPGPGAAAPQAGGAWSLPGAAQAARGAGAPGAAFSAPTWVPSGQGAAPAAVTMTAPGTGAPWQGQVPPGGAWSAPPGQPAPAPVAPAPGGTLSQPSVAGALEPEPLSLMSRDIAGRTAGVLAPLQGRSRFDGAAAISADPALGWRRLSDIAGHFGTAYHQFVLETSQLPPAEAAADPDVSVGRSLAATLSRTLQSRDLGRARRDYEGMRGSVPPSSRFKPHLAALDETLRAMGH